MATSSGLREIGLRLYAAFNARDEAALRALARTPEVAAKLAESLHEAVAGMPDMRVEVMLQVAEGDALMSTFQVSGTHEGRLFRFDGTGRRVSFKGLHIVMFDGDKVATIKTWLGKAAALEQMGIQFMAPRDGQPAPLDPQG